MPLVYEDRTQTLLGGFFAVQNEVGLGRDEEAYHQACKLWFAERELPVASKPPVPLMLGGMEAYVLFPDFVAWNEITIELKALPHKLGRAGLMKSQALTEKLDWRSVTRCGWCLTPIAPVMDATSSRSWCCLRCDYNGST